MVFNALHGPLGEDGKIQGLLETLRLPYTHSGTLASALAMDKRRSKPLFAKAGLHVATDCEVTLESLQHGDPLPRPYVVKPIDEGSSLGVLIVMPSTDLAACLPQLDGYRRLMAEAFIPGRELTVSCFQGLAKVVTELAPDSGLYDYEAKYVDGKTEHILPAALPADIYAQCLSDTQKAYAALNCRGVARADFRYNPEAAAGEQLVILEVNTQPGMTGLSLTPEQAAHLGQSFADLVHTMVEDASCDR